MIVRLMAILALACALLMPAKAQELEGDYLYHVMTVRQSLTISHLVHLRV